MSNDTQKMHRMFSAKSLCEENYLPIPFDGNLTYSLELPKPPEGHKVSHINIGLNKDGIVIGDYLLAWGQLDDLRSEL